MWTHLEFLRSGFILRLGPLVATILSLLLPGPRAAAEELGTNLGLEVVGIELRVLDVDQAVAFLELYGFEADGQVSAGSARVKNGSAVIDLVGVTRRVDIDDRLVSNTHVNLRVEDLNTAIAELQTKAGYQFVGELRRPFPLGFYAIVKDPSGNTFHLIEPHNKPAEGIKRGIFNVGITLTDMVEARKFYRDKLGFEIFSEDYFPPDVPLQRKGTLSLVLHQTAEGSATIGYPESAATVVVLSAPDLAKAAAALKAQGVRLLEEEPQVTPRGRSMAFTDPFGIVFQLRERVGEKVR